jgi:hypothetical protein
MSRIIGVLVAVLTMSGAYAEELHVDPNVGNSTFNALFDAKLGERINATSSAVECSVTYDEKVGTMSGSCSVPLTTIKVDNEDTKTEHFQQWATNKKMEPKDCKFEAEFTGVKLGRLIAETPVKFSAEVPFTVCGRHRTDGAKEHVNGNAILFPPGSYGEAKTVRVRARIERFNRDKYRIGPKYTDGWISRVQSLAKVVADEGTIELSLFAKAKDAAASAQQK